MTKNISVFTGTFDNSMELLKNEALANELQDSGVGLYGHGNGIYYMAAHNEMSELISEWDDSNAASGVAEFGMGFGYAQGTVTIKNNSASDQIINVGDIFTGTNGTYSVIGNPGQPGSVVTDVANVNGYVSKNNSMGYYIVKAGSSLSLTVESNTIGTQANSTQSNSIGSYNGTANGISIESSSAISGGTSISDITSYFNGDSNAPMYYLYQKYGYMPLQGNVNINGDYITSNEASSWKIYVDAARNMGVLNIAPITSYNGLNANYAQDFATSTYWASTRETALYGGGISFDMPPGFALNFTSAWFPAFSESANTYINFIESQIKWANSEGLRSSLIISPQNNDTQNGGLMSETQALIARLKQDGALPSQFIVENYGNVTSNTYGTDTNNLNAISEWLASQNLTVATNSESGQEVEGSAHNQVDTIMTGIKDSISISNNSSQLVWDNPSLFATKADTQINATISLDTDGLYFLSDLGTLSSDKKTLQYSGTYGDITKVLQQLRIAENINSLNSGTANISLTFVDKAGTISGKTQVNYSGSNTSIDYLNGDSKTINATSGTAFVTGNMGSLDFSGGASVVASGIFNNLNISNSGSSTSIYIALNGTATLNNVSNSSGITINNNATLNLTNSDAFISSNNGNINKTDNSSLTVNGVVKNFNISGDRNYTNIALSSSGKITNATGNIGVTLDSDSTLEVVNSVVYSTILDSGTINTGENAYVNLTIKNNGYANVNGGVVAYQSDDGNATFHVGNGTAKLDINNGYTSLFQDMTAYSQSFISGYEWNKGQILATDLKGLDDVAIYYGDGNAYIEEQGQAGFISIANVAEGGISLFTDLNGTNFSQQTNSKSLMIAVEKQNSLYQNINTGNNQLIGNGQSIHINGGTTNLDLETNKTNIDVNMTSGAKVEISGLSNNNASLIFTNYSAVVNPTYADGKTILTGSNNTQVILDGHYSVASTSNYVNGADIYKLTGSQGLLVNLTN